MRIMIVEGLLEAAIALDGRTGSELQPSVYRDRQLQAYDFNLDPMSSLRRRTKRQVVHKRSVMGSVVPLAAFVSTNALV